MYHLSIRGEDTAESLYFSYHSKGFAQFFSRVSSKRFGNDRSGKEFMELFNLYEAPRASKLKIFLEMEGIWFHDNFPYHPPPTRRAVTALSLPSSPTGRKKICAHEKYLNFMSIPSSRAQIRHMGRMKKELLCESFHMEEAPE
jgi:hypothetical protein